MTRTIAAGTTIGLAVIGLIAGWFIGQGLELSGLLSPETDLHLDPENMWAWSALIGAAIGAITGIIWTVRSARP